MLSKFKITYTALDAGQKEVVLEATSKYDAKKRFYFMHPTYEIKRVEEVSEDA